jgi:hypothetical protein
VPTTDSHSHRIRGKLTQLETEPVTRNCDLGGTTRNSTTTNNANEVPMRNPAAPSVFNDFREDVLVDI